MKMASRAPGKTKSGRPCNRDLTRYRKPFAHSRRRIASSAAPPRFRTADMIRLVTAASRAMSVASMVVRETATVGAEERVAQEWD